MPASDGAAIAAAARSLVGAPFRLHGRDRVTGVDCVGLVLQSLGADPAAIAACSQYRMRQQAPPDLARIARTLGLAPVRDERREGDVVALAMSASQIHFGIVTHEGLVHAHAGLGRVTLSPEPIPWPVLGCWRTRP
ncbi:hypothetical protein [Paraurantiacibacter namhicola]|uniref:NlpC/P60 domain-containing protein n=1 Tax=Paraurantiacibacter namhicola TaxID=645517 RepID=A0A1C7D5M4_9SPHN|nr:hypothetical protein [Paraurantiacibacter namhicola]ANU06603.1 hypothetical protein A6F65_00276 [Paraurantiacibacter namhicola]